LPAGDQTWIASDRTFTLCAWLQLRLDMVNRQKLTG
jgi:hypothetical protein